MGPLGSSHHPDAAVYRMVWRSRESRSQTSPHSPPSRVKTNRLSRLREPILDEGLFCPLLVTPELEIIDGHRRFAVITDLDWDEVWVIISTADKLRACADLHPGRKKRRRRRY